MLARSGLAVLQELSVLRWWLAHVRVCHSLSGNTSNAPSSIPSLCRRRTLSGNTNGRHPLRLRHPECVWSLATNRVDSSLYASILPQAQFALSAVAGDPGRFSLRL